MTIKYEGERLDSPNLSAALFDCPDCRISTLYIMGHVSGIPAETAAKVDDTWHESAHKEVEISVRGFKVGDPWPEEFLKPYTDFKRLL